MGLELMLGLKADSRALSALLMNVLRDSDSTGLSALTRFLTCRCEVLMWLQLCGFLHNYSLWITMVAVEAVNRRMTLSRGAIKTSHNVR
jgi:hypothetical protein